jgi:hypothetical protein
MGADAPASAAPVAEAAPAPAPEPAPEPATEKVLPLRSARLAAVEPIAPARPDPALERRLAELEAQVVEQEAMLRRTLTMLVDWVESDSQGVAFRTHAA